MSSAERAAVLAAVALVALACSRSKPSSAEPSADAAPARDAAMDVPAADARRDAAECPALPVSPDVPVGWTRFPGLPCSCDVWYTTAREPAPRWLTTDPGGILELENSWADRKHRFYFAYGDSFGGVQHIAMFRELRKDLQDMVILRLPENELVFQARMPGGWRSTCAVYIGALGQGNAVIHAFESLTGQGPAARVLTAGPAGEPLRVLSAEVTPAIDQGHAVGRNVAGVVNAPSVLDGYTLSPLQRYAGLGSGFSSSGMLAWDDTLFVVVNNAGDVETWAWDPAGGLRRFLPPGARGAVDVGCGLATDGETMLWEEGPRLADGGPSEGSIYVSPFTADPAKLRPRRLATSPGHAAQCSYWKVGGGYAAASLDLNLNGTRTATYVFRLSDGASWVLPNRAGRKFEFVLYVTADELGVVEDFDSAAEPDVSGLYAWAIVRYPLTLVTAGPRVDE